MKRIKFPVLIVLFLILILLFTAFGPEKWVNVSEKIDGNNTGGIGGTYNSLEEAFAKINSVEKAILSRQMAVSASADHTNLLNEEEAEVAFAQKDIPAYTTEGNLKVEPDNPIKVKPHATVNPEEIQIVAGKMLVKKAMSNLKLPKTYMRKINITRKIVVLFVKKQ